MHRFSPRARLGRISALDMATILVLAIAAFMLLRPGSALSATVKQWIASRRMVASSHSNWSLLATRSLRLYSGDAPPEVVEFSDYECPFCRASAATVDSALRLGARIAIVQVPLLAHVHARPAALAALCAAKAGSFADVHEHLLTTSEWQSQNAAAAIRPMIDTSMTRVFDTCAASGEGVALLNAQLALAESLSVPGTPTFVADGRVMTSAITAANLVSFAKGR